MSSTPWSINVREPRRTRVRVRDLHRIGIRGYVQRGPDLGTARRGRRGVAKCLKLIGYIDRPIGEDHIVKREDFRLLVLKVGQLSLVLALVGDVLL